MLVIIGTLSHSITHETSERSQWTVLARLRNNSGNGFDLWWHGKFFSFAGKTNWTVETYFLETTMRKVGKYDIEMVEWASGDGGKNWSDFEAVWN